jgi:hypothetical protein
VTLLGFRDSNADARKPPCLVVDLFEEYEPEPVRKPGNMLPGFGPGGNAISN